MKILIYGGGAVGIGVASCLINSGAEVDIIARNNTVAALKLNGLHRNGIFGEVSFQYGDFNAYSKIIEINKDIKYDFILVCTKSYDSSVSAKDIYSNKQIYNTDTKIVLFQNGWGSFSIFENYFPKYCLLNARVITGFYRNDPNHVKITVHADDIHIGSLCDEKYITTSVKTLCNLISNGGITCSSTIAIEKDLWAKMLYNCSLNPLGAVLNVPYGKLGENSFTKDTMRGIVSEVFLVIKASGFSTHWETPDEYLSYFYEKLLPPTYAHASSMLQDIRAEKKTEIEWLNGAVIRLAEEHMISVPFNLMMHNLIKYKESDFY